MSVFAMVPYIVMLCIAWVAWKFVRYVFTPKSQIDNLPGPASPSWITGKCIFHICTRRTRYTQTIVAL